MRPTQGALTSSGELPPAGNALPLPPASSPARPAAAPPVLPLPPSLGTPPVCALFLDFDGTLVDIAPAPDAIRPDPALPALLAEVMARLDGRLALVSGRPLADLDRWLGGDSFPAAGSHGSEWRPHAGAPVEVLAGPVPAPAEAELRRYAREHPGLLVESKPFGIALHYRRRPETEAEAVERAEAIAAAGGLAVKRGKLVVELVSPGADKGSAVLRFLGLPAFAGATPFFIGDDLTDEDAFAAVRQRGGEGILVGAPRGTAARWRLGTVGEVHRWLRTALG